MPPPAAAAAAALPPRQARSQATEARILAAAEQLLGERGHEQLTIEDIAEHAHISIGAFYKRFRGKSSLLPLLLRRVQDAQTERIRSFIALPEAQQASLRQRIEMLLQKFSQAQREQRELFRALLVGSWSEDAQSVLNDPRSGELLQELLNWLAARREEVRHPQPDLALSLGLFTALTSVQAAVLFQRLPPSLPVEAYCAEVTRMFCSYLELD